MLVLLILTAAARLFPTYTIFTATADEPFHIGAGMEWLERGTYKYEPQHPPLARVAVALGPYLTGIRSRSFSKANDEGNAVLFSNDRYFSNLRLARLGTLPFLALGSAVVWAWGRRWFGRATALYAVFIFTFLPPILGHAGLATVDMACAATVAATLYQWLRWIEQPNYRTAVLLGFALAIALLSKFPSIPFLFVCFSAVLVYCRFFDAKTAPSAWKNVALQIGAATAVTSIVLWAGYRFSTESLVIKRNGQVLTAARFENPLLRRGVALIETPLPLGEMAAGIKAVYRHNESGHDTYLLGEYRRTGWWYFFPVVLAVKTPLGFLILFIAGAALILGRHRRYSWQQKMTIVFFAAILLVCMASRIDLGVRHVLPIYPLVSIVAAHALAELGSALSRPLVRTTTILLALWGAVSSIAAHPDYMAYFNAVAFPHPERILVESDLDWGQDLHRLVARLNALGIKELAISYFGTAPLDRVGLPSYRALSPTTPTSGYIAISVHNLVLLNAQNGSFGWLKKETPDEKIGKSIYLFRLEPR